MPAPGVRRATIMGPASANLHRSGPGSNVRFWRSSHSLLRSTSRVVLTAPRSFSIGGIVCKRQFETTFLVAENAAKLRG